MNAITPSDALDHIAIRAECKRLKEQEGLDYTAQAKQSGVPYGTFTNYVNDTYQGNVDKVGANLKRWLDTRGERAATAAVLPLGPGFVETATARNGLAMLAFAQAAPDVVVLAGGAGIGKTELAKRYRATHPNVWLATMQPCTSGIHTALAEVAEVMSVEERSANRLSRAIGRRVKDTGALLIVDEAQHLQTAALDQIRSLHDAWGIGIALIGNESVYSRLEGEGRKSSLAQLYSRVGMRLTQAKPKPEDIAALIAAWGIGDPSTVKTLTAIAGKPGALRGMTKVLRLAAMLGGHDPDGGPVITEANVRGAWRQLGNQMVD